eukprot:219153-Chlamydomonas_euryale.AAC.1
MHIKEEGCQQSCAHQKSTPTWTQRKTLVTWNKTMACALRSELSTIMCTPEQSDTRNKPTAFAQKTGVLNDSIRTMHRKKLGRRPPVPAASSEPSKPHTHPPNAPLPAHPTAAPLGRSLCRCFHALLPLTPPTCVRRQSLPGRARGRDRPWYCGCGVQQAAIREPVLLSRVINDTIIP